jgi:hypothetical protein
VIKLRVLLDHDLPVKSYRASLQTAEGREILTMGGLKETPRPARTPDATSGVIVDSVGRPGPPYRILDVFVPTSALTPGAYLLSVRADTRPDDELTAVPFVVRPAAR